MSAATELLQEMHDRGIRLTVEGGTIRYLSPEPLSRELIVRLKTHKADIITLLEYQKRRHGTSYLKNGEFRVRGLLPSGTMIDKLVELGASDDFIERQIGPQFLSPKTWKRWQEIKNNGKPN